MSVDLSVDMSERGWFIHRLAALRMTGRVYDYLQRWLCQNSVKEDESLELRFGTYFSEVNESSIKWRLESLLDEKEQWFIFLELQLWSQELCNLVQLVCRLCIELWLRQFGGVTCSDGIDHHLLGCRDVTREVLVNQTLILSHFV